MWSLYSLVMVNLWTSGQVVKDLSLCATAGLEGGSDQACLLTENSSGEVRHMIQLCVCGFSFIKLFVLKCCKTTCRWANFLNCAILLWSVGYICLFAMVLFWLVCEFTFSLTCYECILYMFIWRYFECRPKMHMYMYTYV